MNSDPAFRPNEWLIKGLLGVIALLEASLAAKTPLSAEDYKLLCVAERRLAAMLVPF